MKNQPLALFGKFLIEKLFDRGLLRFHNLSQNNIKSEKLFDLQQQLEQFTTEEKEIIRKTIHNVLISAMHDFLFALEEENDLDGRIKIVVDNQNIANLSDGLQGEIFLQDGWINLFSDYKNEINQL